MFRRMFSRQPALHGAPESPRHKTYAAQSGFAYRYAFLGFRENGGAVEYVFEITTHGPLGRQVGVRLHLARLTEWETAHERALSAAERHAIAKLALFQALDESPAPAHVKAEMPVTPAMLDEFAATLGLLE